MEDNELYRPSARKYVDDAVIHVSQYMLGGAGALTICDLGQARIGKMHRCKAMPVPYRAPEVILGMTWGNAVDIWSVGLLVRRPGAFFFLLPRLTYRLRPGTSCDRKASFAFTINLKSSMMLIIWLP